MSSSLLAKPAVVLLSGGLDSATALALAIEAGFRCHALSFDYGQRHRCELDAAAALARQLGAADHRVVQVGLRSIGGSALTDAIDVPKERALETMSVGIPITYVPARNTIFLSIALGLAEVLGALRHLHWGERRGLFWLSRLSARVPGTIREARGPGDQSRSRRHGKVQDPRASSTSHQGSHHPRRRSAGRRLWTDDELLRPGPTGQGMRQLAIAACCAGSSRPRGSWHRRPDQVPVTLIPVFNRLTATQSTRSGARTSRERELCAPR